MDSRRHYTTFPPSGYIDPPSPRIKWRDVGEILDRAISIRRGTFLKGGINNNSNRHKLIYPAVIAHVPTKDEETVEAQLAPTAQPQSHNFIWRGRKYNSDTIYQVHPATIHHGLPQFTRFGRYTFGQLPPNTVQIPYKHTISYTADAENPPTAFPRVLQMDSIGPELEGSGDFIGKVNYITIDLGKPMTVSHIGIMGNAVHEGVFPRRRKNTNNTSAISAIGRHWNTGMPDGATIRYTNETKCVGGFVAKFEMQVASSRGKWTKVGVYAGNNDRMTEVVVQLHTEPVVGRQFRIVPLVVKGRFGIKLRMIGPIAPVPVDSAPIEQPHSSQELVIPLPVNRKFINPGRYNDYSCGWKDKKNKLPERRTDDRNNLGNQLGDQLGDSS